MKLKILKIYIETNLAITFIRSFEFHSEVFILYVCKKNCFCLFADYQRLNNLTIKNFYLLFLIKKSFDYLKQVKQFT